MTKIKMILFGLGAVAIVTALGLGYMHYTNLVNENKVLTANNEKLELSVQTQQDTITAAEQTIRDWQEALRLVEERNRQLEGIANEARLEQQRIQRMFDELDIAGAAVEDPAALSADLNRRFDYLNCMFERNTGTGNQDCASRLAETPADAALP
jgi:cell division protein FtsB